MPTLRRHCLSATLAALCLAGAVPGPAAADEALDVARTLHGAITHAA